MRCGCSRWWPPGATESRSAAAATVISLLQLANSHCESGVMVGDGGGDDAVVSVSYSGVIGIVDGNFAVIGIVVGDNFVVDGNVDDNFDVIGGVDSGVNSSCSIDSVCIATAAADGDGDSCYAGEIWWFQKCCNERWGVEIRPTCGAAGQQLSHEKIRER